MIICVCHAVSDSEINAWKDLGGRSIAELQTELGVGTWCGTCVDCASELLGGPPAAGRGCTDALPLTETPVHD
ncbi:MAG: (2Fe-2S)-binding protein [Burkholderiaceae bacterium]